MRRVVGWWDRHQVVLYLAAIVGSAVTGLLAPGISPILGATITPVLALLLFATFLGVPLTRLGRALRDTRFLLALMLVNFVAVPAVVFGLSRFVADDEALLVGVLLVLLTPCVDYVIVFTGLAGGARDRLLAATPLLMVVQIVLLPLYLWLFAGAEAAAAIEVRPFVEAFLALIVLPLGAAALVQWFARRESRRTPNNGGPAPAHQIERVLAGAMVPLMMLALAVVVASQVAVVGAELPTLLRLVPLYLAFALLMLAVGLIAGRLAKLDVPAVRALVFSGTTRNSLVVLPLALALPPSLGLAPLAVVTQTLVELVVMVAWLALVPRLVREASTPVASTGAQRGAPHP